MEKSPAAADKRRIFADYGFWAAALGLAALGFWLTSRAGYSEPNLAFYADRGELLFHAFRDKDISFSMPLFGFIVAFLRHFSFTDIALLGRILSLLLYVASYALGAANGSPVRGLSFLLAPLFLDFTHKNHELEQVLYSLLLVLYVNFQTLRCGKSRLFYSLLAGLSLGATLLVRSPLFLFPLVVLLYDYFYRGRGMKKYLLNSALFLVSAYILLVPWARLNYSLSDRFIPLEGSRSDCNIITGAMGTLYTMEGDCRSFAGLTETSPVLPWAVKTVLAEPLNYAEAVFKRLWAVFLMFPVLIPLALIGLALDRRKENFLLAWLAAYFIAVHCLLSIEERYFYPLRYLLGFLAVSGLWRAATKAREEGASKNILACAVFSVALIPAGLLEYYLWAYPARSAIPVMALDRGVKDFPGDTWLLKKRGRTYLEMGRTEDALAVFEEALAKPGGSDPHLSYIVKTVKSPAAPGTPPDVLPELLAVRLFKELELGDVKSAEADFVGLRDSWQEFRSGLREARTRKDFALLERIRATNRGFLDSELYNAALYWPAEKRALILSRLAALTGLTAKLEYLKQESLCLRDKKSCTAAEALLDRLGFASPAYEFNYRLTAGTLLAELLARTAVSEAGLPAQAGEVLGVFKDGLKQKDFRNLAEEFRGSARGVSGREAGLITALYENRDNEDSFRRAAEKLYSAYPGNFTCACFYLNSAADKKAAAERIVKNLSSHPLPVVSAARLYHKNGREADALRLLSFASGGDAEAAGEAAGLYQELGRYDDALSALDKALRADPENARLHNARGVVLRFLKKDGAAEAAFRRALRLSPAFADARLNLAAVAAARGGESEARFLYNEALAFNNLTEETRETVLKDLALLKK
ncbi:MAG: tetratricopeptide repeat protein [Elusimicrobiota bacterium]|nr:tetratricopeptide repeat protein [Elusimicrobiota bacterium]